MSDDDFHPSSSDDDFSASEDEWLPSKGKGNTTTQSSDDFESEIESSQDELSESENEEETPKAKSKPVSLTGNRGKAKRISPATRKLLYNKYSKKAQTSSNAPLNSSLADIFKNSAFKKKTEIPKRKASDSESSGDDYLVDPNQLDLNSKFFDTGAQMNKENPVALMNLGCNAGVRLSDSESEHEAEVEHISPKSSNMQNLIQHINEQSISSCMSLQKLEEFSRKIEEAKAHLKNYKSKTVVEVEDSKNAEVKNLLAMGEGEEASIEAEENSDSESDWEEVSEEKKIAKPVENIEITVKVAGETRKKRNQELEIELFIKRQINRVKRINQLDLHKCSVAFSIAHGNFINSVLNKSKLQATSLSLVPVKYHPKIKTDLKYFEDFSNWFRKFISLESKELYPECSKPLEMSLLLQLFTKKAECRRDYVLLFITLLRSIGVDCRLVLSANVPPKRPSLSDLVPIDRKIMPTAKDDLKMSEENAAKNVKVGKEPKTVQEKTSPEKVKQKSSQKSEKRKDETVKEVKKLAPRNTRKRNADKIPTPMQEKKPGSKKLRISVSGENEDIPETDKNIQKVKQKSSQKSAKTKDETVKEVKKAPRNTRKRNADKSPTPMQEKETGCKKLRISVSGENEDIPEIDNKETTTKSKSKKISESNDAEEEKIECSPRLKENTESVLEPIVRRRSPRDIASTQKIETQIPVTQKSRKALEQLLTVPQLDGADDAVESVTTRRITRSSTNNKKESPRMPFEKKDQNNSPAKKETPKKKDANKRKLFKASRVVDSGEEIKKMKRKKSISDFEDDSDFELPTNSRSKAKASKASKVIEGKTKNQPAAKKDNKRLSNDSSNTEGNKKAGIDFWVEAYNAKDEKWITIDIFSGKIDCVDNLIRSASRPISYVFAWNNDGTIKDISARYVAQWNTASRMLRVEKEWLDKALNRFKGDKSEKDSLEDKELDKLHADKPMPKTIGEFKNHPLYALQRHLLKFEALYPPDVPSLGFIRGEPIYARDCVFLLQTREKWYKQARVVKAFETPYKVLKHMKYDRVNNTFLRNQPLDVFGIWQTEPYDPPTAENGNVPRNAYGNVELFKECMLPKKTVHLQLPGLDRVCRKLKIDCARAVIGFESHKMRSHPIYDGFVVCEEFSEKLVEEWYNAQEEEEKKEQEKIDKRVYGNWKKLIKGLFIRKKLQNKYNFDNL